MKISERANAAGERRQTILEEIKVMKSSAPVASRNKKPQPAEHVFEVNGDAIRFATKLKVSLHSEKIIGFAATTKSMDISDVGAQTGLALARMELGPVLLIDANLRRPRLHEIFHLQDPPGLASVLEGKIAPFEAVCQTSEAGLNVLPAGITSMNLASLLASTSFRFCLETVCPAYTFVIVQVPPMDELVEASMVALITEGIVLVVESSVDTLSRLRALRKELGSLGVNVLGALLHKG